MKHVIRELALAVMILAATLSASAQERISVVVIDGYPARALWVQEMTNFFIPEVDRRLAETGNFVMDWQESYGGTIVKPRGVLEGVQLGLGDIGIVTTIFHSSKLPSQGIASVMPFVAADARAVAQTVDSIARDFPTMRNEFLAQNQIYLATAVVLDSYQVFTTRAVQGLDDLQGLKIAGAGLNLRYLEGIPGAAGVRGNLTDFYNMLQTGLVDAAILWPEAAATFRISEVAPYMLRVDLGAVNSKAITVNADYWAALPAEVQDVLKAVAIDYRDRVADIAMERAAQAEQAYVAAGGTIIEISEEDRTAWAAAMPNIAQDWARVLNENNAPGTEMLEAYLSKLASLGYVGVRDWSLP